jgi:hypothetical protein
VARGLEAEWESRLRDVTAAEGELRDRQQHQPLPLSAEQRARLDAVAADLRHVWTAHTTTDRDRKELLRTLLEDVTLVVRRAESCAHLTLRWRGGALTTLDVPLQRSHSGGLRTDEDTLALLPRLAAHYSDADILGGQVKTRQSWTSENRPPRTGGRDAPWFTSQTPGTASP